ncbi:MAG TPA: crossover junction endodeoxyribonuclease RuvC [Rhodanobacteraceae bacterium]|nr:crossover junction endodeoxyribonuclease RuvC [Rhodanobacteraceae bacterium]
MPASVPRSPFPVPHSVRILGIDPGSQRTGVGIIEADATGRLRCVVYATLRVAGEETFPLRLKRIYDELGAIIDAEAPVEAAVERVFMAKNADSALKLGQARGAAICAAVGRGLVIHEYAPNAIKQAVVGKGHAGKEQVQHMVGILLNMRGPLQADAADALAIAITHAHLRASEARTGIAAAAWGRRR